jgi:Short C-terminal domain/Phospholipase_D-nuclease N-terminal
MDEVRTNAGLQAGNDATINALIAFMEDRMTTLATLRHSVARPFVPLLAVAAVLVAGCNQVGTSSFTFWDAIWSMVGFFFLFMFLFIFISLFGDIFRRNDLSGAAKAGWILFLVILPFLGCLIYIVMRPKVTAQDVQMMAQAEAANKAVAGVSTADELAKLQQLKDSGVITAEQYEDLKAKAIAG